MAEQGNWLTQVVPLVSALTALVAVVISPIISWKIAKRQINAAHVSSKRQVWIDELRRDVAQALAILSRIEELRRPADHLSRDEQLEVFDRKAEAELLALELLTRIKLRLNPLEQPHNDLVAAFKRLAEAAPNPEANETDEQKKVLQERFRAARDDVVVISQKILKNEWNRVRRGE